VCRAAIPVRRSSFSVCFMLPGGISLDSLPTLCLLLKLLIEIPVVVYCSPEICCMRLRKQRTEIQVSTPDNSTVPEIVNYHDPDVLLSTAEGKSKTPGPSLPSLAAFVIGRGCTLISSIKLAYSDELISCSPGTSCGWSEFESTMEVFAASTALHNSPQNGN